MKNMLKARSICCVMFAFQGMHFSTPSLKINNFALISYSDYMNQRRRLAFSSSLKIHFKPTWKHLWSKLLVKQWTGWKRGKPRKVKKNVFIKFQSTLWKVSRLFIFSSSQALQVLKVNGRIVYTKTSCIPNIVIYIISNLLMKFT